MTDTPARLLTLLSLLQTPREWPGTVLAARLAVSTRTIRRDIDRLRGLGYPVESTMGAEGGCRLVAGAAMSPLLLDDEEAVAITVGLRAAARQAVAGIDEASARALAKLEQVLPSRLRRRVRTLGAATVPMPDPGPPVVPEDLAALAAAIANHERVRFGYRDGEGRESRRLAEPHRLVVAGRRWYLVAWDVDRDDWRLFRVDRVRRPHGTGARTTPRELPADDAAAFVTAKLYRTAPTHRAVVTLHAPLEEMRPRVGNAGELTATGPAACRVETHADTLDWLAFRLLALGCEFEVHEPPELAAHLRALAGRITRATSG